ncbi:nuclear RNA export factor 1/2 [Cryptococcus neoformans]|nr:nuclear RNA export factor 1/2 [Cryptococcus neoformans var. grubii]OXH46866.1 nuclear RNA export factor 1/2 [Cryptococcus neoformans var. grubii]OXH50362.1 nuclear RNA export factor 1/2 [Cryptococcus neoformans var. grubii]OXH66615.1 nuclear RNA export factor 1/2 [Cryptococcus neoformans var. grubii]
MESASNASSSLLSGNPRSSIQKKKKRLLLRNRFRFPSRLDPSFSLKKLRGILPWHSVQNSSHALTTTAPNVSLHTHPTPSSPSLPTPSPPVLPNNKSSSKPGSTAPTPSPLNHGSTSPHATFSATPPRSINGWKPSKQLPTRRSWRNGGKRRSRGRNIR